MESNRAAPSRYSEGLFRYHSIFFKLQETVKKKKRGPSEFPKTQTEVYKVLFFPTTIKRCSVCCQGKKKQQVLSFNWNPLEHKLKKSVGIY